MKAEKQNHLLSAFIQALFICWLLAVNIIFYLQFRTLALSRLPHWLTR